VKKLEVIVLGSCAVWPAYKRACSGYLIRCGTYGIILDLGTGAFSNLLHWFDPFFLGSLIITHLHTDHFVDFYPLRYYLQFSEGKRDLPLKVFLPKGGEETLLSILDESGKKKAMEIFQFESIREEEFNLGEISLFFKKVPHPSETYAVKIQWDGKIITYSSDLKYDEGIADFISNSSLFICEATLLEEMRNEEVLHLTSYEAGILASRANVERLLLTHFWPEIDRQKSLREAKKSFQGEILLAEENLRLEV
jgi:ribonuclease BN (tRNA processing enzyme)